jgi:hypothetical protein
MIVRSITIPRLVIPSPSSGQDVKCLERSKDFSLIRISRTSVRSDITGFWKFKKKDIYFWGYRISYYTTKGPNACIKCRFCRLHVADVYARARHEEG